MSEALIAQIVDRLPSLTEAQILVLNSVDTSVYVDSMVKAIAADGVEAQTELTMLQFGDDTDPGVWAIARIAILGILAQGKIVPADSALLVRAWTDVIEPFHSETLAEVAETEVFEVENGLVQDPLPVVEAPVEAPVVPVEVAVESAPVVEPSIPTDPAAGAI